MHILTDLTRCALVLLELGVHKRKLIQFDSNQFYLKRFTKLAFEIQIKCNSM